MKKSVLVLLVVVAVLAAASSIAWAKGGSAKGDDVCWMMKHQGVVKEHWAIFYETGSGIVHEWRYEPNEPHLIFKPLTKFKNKPQGPGWFHWPAPLYRKCKDPTDKSVEDFLPKGDEYWVLITGQ